jgi:glycosyltransferase involved in cell wall biosynthesis
MHLGIDASRATATSRTGTEHYSLRLTQALLTHSGAHAVTLYFREAPASGLFAPGQHRVMPFPRLWTHLRLSWELLTRPPEVLFVPAHVIPAVCPVPTVVTVHDLGYRHFPDAHTFTQRLYLDFSTRYSARAAKHILADSEATKRDLTQFYGTPPEKISVVYPGRDETLTRVNPAAVRAKYHLPEKYLLHVGTLQPRKNLLRLIEATTFHASPFGKLRAGSFTLVLAGRAGWLSQPIIQAARAANVRVLEFVPDEDLAGLYSGAEAFIFPSLYEGFGFPVLEAMACGTPVICSDTSSLPEVAGDAALRVNPQDTAALAAAITQLTHNAELRATLIAKGYEQIKKFSWATAAEKTWKILESVLTK